MNILGIEFVIYVFSKYNKVLSIVIQISLANHFIMKFSSHTLFSFLHYLSIVGKGKKIFEKVIIINEEYISQLN
jgi:hypothetical protein